MIYIVKWKKLPQWQTHYIWNTYFSPHIRYGSCIFYDKIDNDFNHKSLAFKEIQRIYNMSIKKMLNLPATTPHQLINDAFRASSIANIIMKSYNSNGRKWQDIYKNEME